MSLNNTRTISVFATAEVRAIPDRALLDFSITVRKGTLPEARGQLDRRIAVVNQILSSSPSVYQKNVQMNTVIEKEIEMDHDKKRTVFRATADFVVVFEEMAGVRPIYESLLGNPDLGVDIGRPVFYYSNMNELRKEARLRAIACAREKAATLVDALNQRIGRPVNILESPPGAGRLLVQQVPSTTDTSFVDSSHDDVVISGRGPIAVPFSVSVVFEIEDFDLNDNTRHSTASASVSTPKAQLVN